MLRWPGTKNRGGSNVAELYCCPAGCCCERQLELILLLSRLREFDLKWDPRRWWPRSGEVELKPGTGGRKEEFSGGNLNCWPYANEREREWPGESSRSESGALLGKRNPPKDSELLLEWPNVGRAARRPGGLLVAFDPREAKLDCFCDAAALMASLSPKECLRA